MSDGVSIDVGATGFIGQSIFEKNNRLGYKGIGILSGGAVVENQLRIDSSEWGSIANKNI